MRCWAWKRLVIAGVFIVACVPLAYAETGTNVIKGLQDVLLSVMKEADTLGYEGRYRKLAPVIKASHDLPAVAQLSLGKKYWRRLTKEQQAQFMALFAELSISTYASRFNGYNGETFTVVKEKSLPRGNILVETLLTQSDGKQVHFNYLLRPVVGQKWKIINIIVDGVSDLALKRAEYRSILEDAGFSGLVAKLQSQIDGNRQKK